MHSPPGAGKCASAPGPPAGKAGEGTSAAGCTSPWSTAPPCARQFDHFLAVKGTWREKMCQNSSIPLPSAWWVSLIHPKLKQKNQTVATHYGYFTGKWLMFTASLSDESASLWFIWGWLGEDNLQKDSCSPPCIQSAQRLTPSLPFHTKPRRWLTFDG